MILKYLKPFYIFLIALNFTFTFSSAEVIKSFKIKGNERISNDTIIMFSNVSVGTDINSNDLNIILKNLYDSNFFDNVSVNFSENVLLINVEEFPIIQNIKFEGIKANKIKEKIFKDLKLKQRSSFNQNFLKEDKDRIESSLKDLGYYFSEIEITTTDLNDNKIDLNYNINLGEKAKIRKIKFIGDKVFKDRKLKSIIASEEFRFWKFISGKKFLNQNLIEFDERLLKNFYLNQGYYDVKISSSFAKLIQGYDFELIYNIQANKKFFFNDINLNLPNDFNEENFTNILNLFDKLKGESYSIFRIEKILEEIDKITLEEEFENISAEVDENIVENKINLNFNIKKSDSLVVEKINIFGNNITRESVIRNQLEIDEGDPFNEILEKRSINNLKNLRFFKSVKSEILPGETKNSKIINIFVEEKATGEIMAGAGIGTNGASMMFTVKENNYLGKGIQLSNTIFLNEESIKGSFSVTNPNFNNTDKLVFFNFQATEIDRLTNFGYKTNKTGFSIGTAYEIFDDVRLNVGTSNFYEKMSTNSSASARQKKQEGNYWDSFLNLNFDYDKRNQKYQTSEGFRSRYFIDLPLISDTNTLGNTYNFNYFTELYDNNRSNFSIYLKSVDSISNNDVKLSERLFLPSSKLRGFESGKVGPKDGNDFIGGNYASAINFSSTIPQLFENSENIDLLFFVDAANIWGVDYDSSIDDKSTIRSSLGLGIDWLTPIGPLSFTLAEPLSKANTDITESFRFNLGTTF